MDKSLQELGVLLGSHLVLFHQIADSISVSQNTVVDGIGVGTHSALTLDSGCQWHSLKCGIRKEEKI